MWGMSMDMSRDECMKYLRCLELDAYGNMVSVLRAQGPFTEDKKRLLEELAKVLHISNERHRAEVRRAVNDEKLSFIAEQLNGPNTWADWAIEGRRSIPLLPRLEARTAFTELANSLSLVIAAANEKKAQANEKHTEPLINLNKNVKNETDSYKELNIEENLPPKNLSPNPTRSTRGRKRKRSLPEIVDISGTIKLHANNKINKIENSEDVNYHQQNLPSPLPNNHSRISEIEYVSYTETSSKSINDKMDSTNDISRTVSPNIKCRNNSSSFNCLNNNNELTSQMNNTAVDVKLNCDSESDRLHSQNNIILETDSSNNQIISEKLSYCDSDSCENTQTCSTKTIEKPRNILHNKSSNTVVRDVCVTQVMQENSRGKVITNGPGPPPIINSTLVAHKKLPLENVINHQCTKEVKINSNNVVDISALSNAKFKAKANVIVVKKVPTQGVKISRIDKECLDKGITDKKIVCLKNSDSTPLKLLPQKRKSNNNDQTINLVPMLNVDSSHEEIIKSNAKSSKLVMFDIQEDVPDKSNSCLTSTNSNEMLINTNIKTALSDIETDNLIEDSNETHSCQSADNLDIILTETITSSGENESEVNSHMCVEENSVSQESTELRNNRESPYEEILMITDSVEEDSQDMLDAQTEIYKFGSNDNICEIQIEETIPEATVQVFNTSLDSSSMNMENYNYLETEEETEVILDDAKETMSTIVEKLNDINNCE